MYPFVWIINYELFKKAQQAKSKKIQDENDSYKKSDLEWEGLTNRLRAEIDELNNDKEKLLTDNKDLNSQLSENETSKEIKEKVESLDVENKLIKEQLNARETQLTSLQAGWYFRMIPSYSQEPQFVLIFTLGWLLLFSEEAVQPTAVGHLRIMCW